MLSPLIEASLNVDNPHALAAFLGLLLLIAVGWAIRSYSKSTMPGKRQHDLMSLALKLLFGFAALATLTLASAGSGNFAIFNLFGQVGDVTKN